MLINSFVKIKNKNKCFEREASSQGETERGAWQQNNQNNQYSFKKRRSLTMKQVKYVMMLAVVGIVGFVFTGCEKNQELLSVKESNNAVETREELIATGEQLLWEKARFDYNYLEEKERDANQFLSTQRLSLEDLKQLHDIANLIYGEYRTLWVQNLKTRTSGFVDSLVDRDLFASEYARRAIYASINLDYSDGTDALDAPNVRLVVDHIGEVGGYLAIPVRVYRKRSKGGWGYNVFQIKRDSQSKYGWKIYDEQPEVPDFSTGEYATGAWIEWMKTDDKLTTEAWEKTQGVVDDEEWETQYLRTRTRSADYYDQQLLFKSRNSTLRVSSYNRQIAATYAYNHAYNYNSNYFSWKPWGVDCANFASQCLVAGGLPQNNDWKYFYKANDPMSSGTPSWRGARELHDYLLADASRGTVVPITYMINAYNQQPSNAWCVLRWGDLIFINRNASGSKKHAMVIAHSYNDTNSHYNGTPRYTLSAHTTDVRDQDFADLGFDYIRTRAVGVKIEY